MEIRFQPHLLHVAQIKAFWYLLLLVLSDTNASKRFKYSLTYDMYLPIIDWEAARFTFKRPRVTDICALIKFLNAVTPVLPLHTLGKLLVQFQSLLAMHL